MIDHLLDSSNMEVKIAVIHAIGNSKLSPNKYIPLLISSIDKADYNLSMAINTSLSDYGSTFLSNYASDITQLLYSNNPNTIRIACDLLSKYPELLNLDLHYNSLLNLMLNPALNVTYEAGKVIENYSNELAIFKQDLIKLLQTNDSSKQLSILQTITKLNAIEPQDYDLIIKMLRSKDPRVFTCMLDEIKEWGCKANYLLPVLKNFYHLNHFGYSSHIEDTIMSVENCRLTSANDLAALITSNNTSDIVLAIKYLEHHNNEVVKHITELLNIVINTHYELRRKAAFLLSKNASQIPTLCNKVSGVIASQSEEIKMELLFILHEVPLNCESLIEDIITCLKYDHDMLGYYAAICLGQYVKLPNKHINEINSLLLDPNKHVRMSACEAVNRIQIVERTFYINLIELLDDSDPSIRASAITALSRYKNHSDEIFDKIGELIYDETDYVSAQASSFILTNERAFSRYKTKLIERLHNLSGYESATVINAVRFSRIRDNDLILELVNYLDKIKSLDQYINWLGDTYMPAFNALNSLGPFDLDIILNIIELSHNNMLFKDDYHFLAYYFAGGDNKIDSLINILLEFNVTLISNEKSELKEASILTLLQAHEKSVKTPYTRTLIEKRLIEYINTITWSSNNIHILLLAKRTLENTDSVIVEIINKTIRSYKSNKIMRFSYFAIITHLTFWFLLLLLYPRSNAVQAFFFWNKWARRIFGLFYVELLLKWVPYFRNILFTPFINNLKADLLEGDSINQKFYTNIKTKCEDMIFDDIFSLQKEFKGRILLESTSGMGKTYILTYIIQNSKKISVYLPAWKCSNGVMQAIQEKILGPAQDISFLRDLIHSGHVEIYIDGLNEASMETCNKIRKFAEEFYSGNIFIASQPFNWIKPSGIKIINICPLSTGQVDEYLKFKAELFSDLTSNEAAEYNKKCKNFIDLLVNVKRDAKELVEIISNPMELDTISFLIYKNIEPALFNIYEQQYILVKEEYSRLNFGNSFPLEDFSSYAYYLKKNKLHLLDDDRYRLEFEFLFKFRMIIPYPNVHFNDSRKSWIFRHDKIIDFFVSFYFMSVDKQKMYEHINDASFHGVYLFLAYKLPHDEVYSLREIMIQNAVNKKDHYASDLLIKALRYRHEFQD